MKHLFIINPKAGKGQALKIIPEIKEIFKSINEDYIIEITKEPGNATEIVKKYTEKGKYRVYSVGGDGTLNEVLNGMVNSDSSLGVIPSGSGNDFIRSICNQEIACCRDMLINTIKGSEEKIDLSKINDRYFINISSVGVDAEVANNARKFKNIPFVSGGLAYILSALTTVFRYKHKKIKLKLDGEEIDSQITLLALANGKYYGGGVKVAPLAELNDGAFDVCVIDKLSRTKMLVLFPKLIRGRHSKVKEVSFYRAKKITITSKENFCVNVDGEIMESEKIDFEIIPKAINIIIPNGNQKLR